jgi:hypothetical protein
MRAGQEIIVLQHRFGKSATALHVDIADVLAITVETRCD